MAADKYDPTKKLPARPNNWGIAGEADYRVEVTGTGGTAAILTITLGADGATVAQARFKSRGVTECLALLARAVGSFEGQTLQALTGWQVKQIAEAIGEFPIPMSGPSRDALHLALLALRNVLHQADAAHAGESGRAAVVSGEDQAGNTVCYCMEVSEGTILDAIRNRGCTTVGQITAKTGAVGGCGTCRPEVQAILDLEGVTPEPDDPTAPYRRAGPPWGPGEGGPVADDAAGDSDVDLDIEIDLREDGA